VDTNGHVLNMNSKAVTCRTLQLL